MQSPFRAYMSVAEPVWQNSKLTYRVLSLDAKSGLSNQKGVDSRSGMRLELHIGSFPRTKIFGVNGTRSSSPWSSRKVFYTWNGLPRSFAHASNSAANIRCIP